MGETMKRREVLAALAGVIGISLAVPARAAGARWRIGYLDGGTETARAPLFQAFRRRMGRMGYAEGSAVVYDARYAGGNFDRVPGLARELLSLNPNAFLTATTPAALAARAATSTIPIVMIAGADPVAIGLVQSLARPGGNLTGVTNVVTDLAGKRLEIIRQIVPSAQRIAIMLNPDDPNAAPQLRAAEAAAKNLRVEPRPVVPIRTGADIKPAFDAAVSAGAGAAMRMVDPLTLTLARETAEMAATLRLPTIYPWRKNVEAGGLVAYGTDLADQYVQAAGLMDKILKGAAPADLPVEQPTKFELVINLKTARALNLQIPKLLLAQASDVIE